MTMLTKVRSGHLILIDTDSRRRAAACYSLNLTGVFVDPVEDLSELEAAWPGDAVILIHDDGQAVSALAKRMLEAKVWLPFVAYAASPTAKMIVDAMSAGATDYAEWPLSAESASRALRVTEQRDGCINHLRLRQLTALVRIGRLTKREREVLSAVSSGLSNRQIGEKLSISPRTVEIHRANMLGKIGAAHTSQAIRLAVEAGLDSSLNELAA